MEGQRIDSKLMLFTVVLVLITLLLLNYLFKNNSKEKIWDYNNITTAEDIIYIGNKVEDRKIYYNIEQIVKDYITSYEVVDENENVCGIATIEDMLETLVGKIFDEYEKNML